MNPLEQRLEAYLSQHENTGVEPVGELTSINQSLDRIGVPRTYPGSDTPCTTRERVNALVQLCILRGFVWQDSDTLEEVF